MSIRMLPRSVYAVTGAVLLLCVPTLQAEAQPRRAKVDRAVRASLASGARSLNIIITVNAGCRQAVRAALVTHGHDIDADFTVIDAVAAEVHGADIAPLAASACVRAIAADADVRASAQVGHARSTSGWRNTSADAVELQPSQTLISTLRDTLGLPHQADWAPAVPTGRNIGIAIVDSGIALNADFEGRITAFYDYTRGTSRKTSRP
jgi:hypothetical protein